MVQLIVGKKGKGKTIQLLDKVNNEVKNIAGNIVYLDKSMAHMYELNNKVISLSSQERVKKFCSKKNLLKKNPLASYQYDFEILFSKKSVFIKLV